MNANQDASAAAPSDEEIVAFLERIHVSGGPGRGVFIGIRPQGWYLTVPEGGRDHYLDWEDSRVALLSRLPRAPAPAAQECPAGILGALLAGIREAGWSVACHNDYQLNGEPRTFWLFTHPSGRWAKGEGETDVEALTGLLAAAPVHQAAAKPVRHFSNGPARFDDWEFLLWIADRLEHVHGENPNYDYMHKLRKLGASFRPSHQAAAEPQRLSSNWRDGDPMGFVLHLLARAEKVDSATAHLLRCAAEYVEEHGPFAAEPATEQPAKEVCPRCGGSKIDPQAYGHDPREKSACLACGTVRLSSEPAAPAPEEMVERPTVTIVRSEGVLSAYLTEPAGAPRAKEAGEVDHRPKCRRCGLPVQQPTSRHMEPVAYIADGSVMHAHCFTGDPSQGVTSNAGRHSPEPAAPAPAPERHGTSREEMGRVFDRLHHPDSFTRQLADWHRGDPRNPPPKVREALDQFAQVSRDARATPAPAIREALQMMLDEKIDYMRLNNLGDPEKQHTVKVARAAIAATPLSAQNGVDRATVEKCIAVVHQHSHTFGRLIVPHLRALIPVEMEEEGEVRYAPCPVRYASLTEQIADCPDSEDRDGP